MTDSASLRHQDHVTSRRSDSGKAQVPKHGDDRGQGGQGGQARPSHEAGGVSFEDDVADDDVTHDDQADVTELVCQAAERPARPSPQRERLSQSAGGAGRVGRRPRRASSAGPRGSPRPSSSLGGGGPQQGAGEEGLHSAEVTEAARRLTLTERRLAVERERFSAKNLFNIVRATRALPLLGDAGESGARPDNGQDGLRKAARPRTAPAMTSGRRRHHAGFLRPTTSSASRLTRFSDPSFSADFAFQSDMSGRFHRRLPRSRKELEKLARLPVDPSLAGRDEGEEGRGGEAEVGEAGRDSMQQQLLHHLHHHQRPALQARVATFLAGIQDFNRSCRRSGLEHLLHDTS